jgi:VCBS repeat-containing protein
VDDSLSKNINLGTIQMKFKIQSTDGSEQDVTFEFDTNGDTP